MKNSTSYFVQSTLKNAEIFVFGKPKNWKVDFRNHPEIRQILEERGVKTVYIPDCTTFTSKLCSPADFKEEITIGELRVMNGCQAEGLVVPKNEAVLFYTADCPVVVCVNGKKLIAAHAGFGSVVDKLKIFHGIPFKESESIINGIMEQIDYDTNDYEISIVCSIEPDSFVYKVTDPIYGKGNEKILLHLIKTYGTGTVPFGIKHGGISIPNIITEQFIFHGISPDKINYQEINTYSNQNLWSHYEYSKLEYKDCGRNAILVIHK